MTFYFAWVNPDQTTWNDAYKRHDEDVYSFEIEQSEGDFATLNVSIRNPHIGLLNATRKIWAWFSDDNGPLFFGRIVGIPSDILGELVTVNFVARPADYYERKRVHADTLRVLPYYDPIFIDITKQDDPDAVLEGYSRYWHVDRVTHAATTSDVIDGEDGSVSFTVNEVIFDSVSISIANVPIRRVNVSATFNWQQRAYGERILLEGVTIGSFNDLAGSWPKTNENLNSGWYVLSASCFPLYAIIQREDSFSENPSPPPMSDIEISWSGVTSMSRNETWYDHLPPGSVQLEAVTSSSSSMESDNEGNTTSTSMSSTKRTIYAIPNYYNSSLVLAYDPNRKYIENISFTLTADMQSVVTLPEDDEVVTLTFDSQSLSETVPPTPGTEYDITNPDFPIGDTRLRSYVTTLRGQSSLEYLLSVARAVIRSNSRSVRITFETTNLSKWRDITLRKNAIVADPRLPGNSATGKVVGYRLALDGETGKLEKSITIACAVGRDGEWTPEFGSPDYAEDGYMLDGYQTYINVKPVLGTDIRYTLPAFAPNDDNADLRIGRLPVNPNLTTVYDVNTQSAYIASIAALKRLKLGGSESQNDGILATFENEAKTWLEEHGTKLTWTLPALDGDFETSYALDVDPVLIPRMIDLEASS